MVVGHPIQFLEFDAFDWLFFVSMPSEDQQQLEYVEAVRHTPVAAVVVDGPSVALLLG